MTDPEVIEMGYRELQFDNLDNLKLRMKINYIPFGTQGKGEELTQFF